MSNKICRKTMKDAIVEYMNPYHIEYIKKYPYNSLYTLFKALEELEKDKLYKIIETISIYYISPLDAHLLKNKSQLLKQVKSKSIEIAKMTNEQVAVNALVNLAMNSLLFMGNPLSINEKIIEAKNNLDSIKYNQQDIIKRAEEKDCAKISEEDAKSTITVLENSIINMKSSQENNFNLYNYFCDNVIKALVEENYFETKRQLELE